MTGLEILAIAGIISSLAGSGAAMAQSSSQNKKNKEFAQGESDKQQTELAKQKAMQEQANRRSTLASVVKANAPEKAAPYAPPPASVAPEQANPFLSGALTGLGNAATQYATWKMGQPGVAVAPATKIGPAPTVAVKPIAI